MITEFLSTRESGVRHSVGSRTFQGGSTCKIEYATFRAKTSSTSYIMTNSQGSRTGFYTSHSAFSWIVKVSPTPLRVNVRPRH